MKWIKSLSPLSPLLIGLIVLGSVLLIRGSLTSCSSLPEMTTVEAPSADDASTEALNDWMTFAKSLEARLAQAEATKLSIGDELFALERQLSVAAAANDNATVVAVQKAVASLSNTLTATDDEIVLIGAQLVAARESLTALKTQAEAGGLTETGMNIAAGAAVVQSGIAPIIPPPWNIIVGSLAGLLGGYIERKRQRAVAERNETIQGVSRYLANGSDPSEKQILKDYLSKEQSAQTKATIKKLIAPPKPKLAVEVDRAA